MSQRRIEKRQVGQTMQIYDNETKTNDTQEYIDIVKVLDEIWTEFLRHLGSITILFFLVVILVCSYSWFGYEPMYEAYSTFVVSSNQTTEADIALAARLANSFEHAFTDSGLRDKIVDELRMDWEDDFKVDVSATTLEDTNFITITVNSDDGIIAQTILELIEENYPDIAKQIVGNITLTSIDATGILTEPTNPFSWITIILQGSLAGLVVIVVILYIYVSNKKTIHSAGDIKRHLNASCIGTVPITSFKKRKKNADPLLVITNDRVQQSYKEAIHTLRIRIERVMEKEEKKVILVTSSLPNEGKSTIAVNLALSIASRGKKVLLIDGDLRAPSVYKYFTKEQMKKKKGLSDILLNNGSIKDAVFSPSIQNLDVILGGERIEDPSEILAGEQLHLLLEEVKKSYDYIIFDSSPAAMLSDTTAIAGIMDAVLFVIRQDYTKIQYAQEGLALLNESGILSLGCVMNYAEAGLNHYGYGYYGSRYSKYRYSKYERYYGKDN
ncbi:Tyrosine-protein kinase YwqD [Clostridiales bacterium CHKCI001]|nr:Tyrosine-protein kinase YwqD [Clostridiales bacterium CHKCI001]